MAYMRKVSLVGCMKLLEKRVSLFGLICVEAGQQHHMFDVLCLAQTDGWMMYDGDLNGRGAGQCNMAHAFFQSRMFSPMKQFISYNAEA